MLRKEYKSTLRYLGEYRWQNLETIIYWRKTDICKKR
jgi:hypothetical protein